MTASPTPSNGPGADRLARKPRLLVLDTPKYQRLLDTLLGREYELLATDNVGEALLLASSTDPDLILLAHQIEQADALMIAREIRESLASAAPILLMLTTDRPTLRREAEKAGCDGFLMKPIDPGKLKSKIESLLKPGPR